MYFKNKNITLFSEAEYTVLYELPEFDDDQRIKYLALTDSEWKIVLSRQSLSAQVYCVLQIGYFKAVKMFFKFD